MNAFDGIIPDLKASNLEAVGTGLESIQEIHQTITNYLKRVNKIIRDYQETKTLPDASYLASYLESYESAKDDHRIPPNKITSGRNSLKENVEPKYTPPPQKQESPKTQTRPRRNAFKEATQNINQLINVPLNTKSRQPQDFADNLQNVYVKPEKLSICNSEEPELAVKVKEEMPAPKRPAPKTKKRKGTSSRPIKQEKIEEEKKVRDSEVIIEEAPVTTVNLVDSSDEGEITLPNKGKKSKRLRISSSEGVKDHEKKRSKPGEDGVPLEEDSSVRTSPSSVFTHVNNATFIAEPKNIEPQPQTVNNATFIAEPKNVEPQPQTVNNNATFITKQKNVELQPRIMNTTMVVEDPMYVNKIPASIEDIMTDDESDNELQNKSPPKPVRSIPKPSKQVFSPFDQSPVKKKVQAFEKLKEEANAIPRLTRTKTRAQAKEKNEAESDPAEQKNNVKEKAKMFTPTASKPVSRAVSSTAAASRNAASSSKESVLSVKSASALKASQAEYREREKRRREKEQEALKKREALMQAQIEEKKRKREEKQLRAQQQREALEKEKLKALEIQRLKDERHKQLLAEQEERKLKQKEEQEKKRLMAKMRAWEEKKKEEERRIEEEKMTEEMTAKLAKQDKDIAKMLQKQRMKQLPIYLKTATPALPTPDCYDSDDERYDQKDIVFPDWLNEKNLRCMLRCAFAAGEAIKNTFFSIQAQTPDLQDIFEVIEPQKLKRTSSALWVKPPRFTMLLPALPRHDETDDFEED